MEKLKRKAAGLPYAPGVYLMKDKEGNVIYVGKAKKLHNRVTQYFQDSVSHTPKTRLMVSKVDDFDIIVAASEFEALVLECSLIKRYQPKYNILLKDDKGYPYLRLNMKEEYPTVKLVSRPADDGAVYYGPFGSRGVTQSLLSTIIKTLGLPDCNRKFPEDIGKGRPCLNYHMNQCAGWCRQEADHTQYKAIIAQAQQLLQGNYKQVAQQLQQQMTAAAQTLNFELAAVLRDRLQTVQNLGKKQLVTAGALADTDVIGFAQTESKACFAVLHFSGGNLLDKEYTLMQAVDEQGSAITSLVKQYYLNRGFAPARILLPVSMEDSAEFEKLLLEQFDVRCHIHTPQRGDNAHLVALATTNAREEAERSTTKEEKLHAGLTALKGMLRLESVDRIEAYDISNISGTDIVSAMVVFQNGKPHKKDYKRFKLDSFTGQNDYGCMHQTLTRRFSHYIQKDAGFDIKPDLLLIDGGAEHAAVAEQALNELGLSFPVYGMVKDDKHRTRALITSGGEQISIDTNQAVFSFVGSIQEEVHRFAITYHRSLRSKRLRHSRLDKIPGIGEKRKQDLLKTFHSITAIEHAGLAELERVLPKNAANAVYAYFHEREQDNAGN